MDATAFSATDEIQELDDWPNEPVLIAGVDRFDPEAVIVGGRDEDVFPVDFVEELARRASAAVEALQLLDPTIMTKEAIEAWAVANEQIRQQVNHTGVKIAGHLDTANPFRTDGFLTAKAYLKHRLKLSGVEAYRRVQTARMHGKFPVWQAASSAGQVGVAQTELMAQVAANPRIDSETMYAGAWELFNDAQHLPYAEFEANARKWEQLADPESAADRAERNRTNRDADVTRQKNGSWRVSASLDDISGAQFAHTFGHYVEAEWEADWAEARERVGDQATMLDLRRTQSQRRADALLAMANAAATCPPWSKRPLPTINYLIDDETYDATLAGERIDPMRYRDMVCRTEHGHEMLPADVVRMSLVAHVRRVVYDSQKVVIDLGRRQRLFKGASREAVMLLATCCAWVGCDAHADWCDADHSIAWKAHGATVPRNGGPLCRRHNLLKELGFRVSRDEHGHWHTFHPDGHEIV